MARNGTVLLQNQCDVRKWCAVIQDQYSLSPADMILGKLTYGAKLVTD